MAHPDFNDQPAAGGTQPVSPSAPMSPGDEARPGTPGTGPDVCPKCGGTGQVDGQPCANCDGTGTVTVGIGGA
jgi:hypothetical protein